MDIGWLTAVEVTSHRLEGIDVQRNMIEAFVLHNTSLLASLGCLEGLEL
jgi:hypothetical protein